MDKNRLLLEITNAAVKTLELEKILDLVYHRVREYGIAEYVDMAVLENDMFKPIRSANGSVIQISETFELYEVKLGNGIVGHAALHNQTIYVPDVKKDKRYIPARADVISEVAIPLRDENRVIGVINFESTKENAYTEEDIKFLESFANQISIAVKNATLFRKLKEEKSKLDVVLEAIPEPVLLLDKEGRVEILNEEAEKRFNIKVGEKIDKIFESKEDIKKIEELMEKKKKETEINVKDRVYNLKINRVGGYNGERVGTCLFFSDITAQKEMDKAKADFTAMVIHDLRSPLTSIMGALDLLAEIISGAVEEKYYNMLVNAREDGMRLLEMVNELLEVSRLERRKIELKKERVKISELINISIRSLELVAQEKKIKIKEEIEDKDLYTEVDKERIARVIINLLDNAIKYSPREKEVVVKQSKYYKNGKLWIKISVKDQGPGIPPDKIPYIFEKYKKIDRKREGLGLGLAISKLIIEAHGGKIGVQSKEGEGSVFWFTLPAGGRDEEDSRG